MPESVEKRFIVSEVKQICIGAYFMDACDKAGKFLAISVPEHLTPDDVSSEIGKCLLIDGKVIQYTEPHMIDDKWFIKAYYLRK